MGSVQATGHLYPTITIIKSCPNYVGLNLRQNPPIGHTSLIHSNYFSFMLSTFSLPHGPCLGKYFLPDDIVNLCGHVQIILNEYFDLSLNAPAMVKPGYPLCCPYILVYYVIWYNKMTVVE